MLSAAADNNFVDLNIIQASSNIVCIFLEPQAYELEKTCSIVGSPCKVLSQKSHNNMSKNVTIGLSLEEIELEYCFNVTASNNFFTVIIEGTFKTGYTFLSLYAC